jgi:hypothetical protein
MRRIGVCLVLLVLGALLTAGGSLATTINYGSVTLSPTWTATHFADVWDLTNGDVTVSYRIDLSGITQTAPWNTSYSEVGLRQVGAGDFNPGPFNTYQGGAGGWMNSLVGDLTPSPGTQSLHDKHNLSASGGRGEGDYDCLVPGTVLPAPIGSTNNYGIWFDRDGVDPWQAVAPGAVDGGTFNTGGVYDIVVTYHAIDAGLGTMFATLNGIATGFGGGYPPPYFPAGISFKGNMHRMQAFAGIWSDGSCMGNVLVTNLTVSGTLASAVTPGPAPSCITPATPCVTIPVDIRRTEAVNMRGYSVTFQLGGPITLCTGQLPTEGTYLNSIGGTAFEVTNNGGGSYTVDGAILGSTCGAIAATGNLFNIPVTFSGGNGTGTVTITEVLARDCDNADIVLVPGPAASITVDLSAPTAITALAAAQVKTGNDGDGTTEITVSWPAVEVGATVHVYRADYGNYPEYDDPPGAGAVPTYPSAAWTLAGSVSSGTTLVDEVAWPNRGFWYYVATVEDACGNVSAVSNMTTGTLNYHLGDVMAGTTDCTGENVVDIADISLLGNHYGVTEGHALYLACLDVGPTTNRSVNARPTTDNKVNFEDLMMFAINFGTVSLTTTPVAAVASDAVWVEGPAKVVAGQAFTVSLRLSGSGSLLGLSAALGWDRSIAELVSVEAGELVTSLGGVVLRGGGGTVDCALLGADRRLTGEGELARVTFRALASGAPQVALAAVDARDAANRTVELTGTPPTLVPAVTSFAPAMPNPFRGTTTLSYALAKGGAVELTVYGVDGRKVATLASGVQEAGSYRLVWDGGAARPGLYYARLTTPEGKFTRTLVLVK